MVSDIFGSKILVVAAHPDDEAIGCGGTLSRLCQEGASVKVIFLSDGESSRDDAIGRETSSTKISERRNNARLALQVLGVSEVEFFDHPDNRLDTIPLLDLTKLVSQHVKSFSPDSVLTHSHSDLNIDHELTLRATLTATRHVGNHAPKLVASFEVLSSSEWSYRSKDPFEPNLFVDISEHIGKKLKALSFYGVEIPATPHARSIESIVALAKLRGATVHSPSAEAFMIQRLVF